LSAAENDGELIRVESAIKQCRDALASLDLDRTCQNSLCGALAYFRESEGKLVALENREKELRRALAAKKAAIEAETASTNEQARSLEETLTAVNAAVALEKEPAYGPPSTSLKEARRKSAKR